MHHLQVSDDFRGLKGLAQALALAAPGGHDGKLEEVLASRSLTRWKKGYNAAAPRSVGL